MEVRIISDDVLTRPEIDMAMKAIEESILKTKMASKPQGNLRLKKLKSQILGMKKIKICQKKRWPLK